MLCDYILLRPEQLQEQIHEYPLALVPFGALEWHSYHLPLGFDGIKAERLLRMVGENINQGVIFPTNYWGAYDTMKFPFTFHFRMSMLQKQVLVFTQALYSMGFRIIVFLVGHYPASQTSHMRYVAESSMRKHPDLAMLAIPEQLLCLDLGYMGDHAAKGETSLGLALVPQLVDMTRISDADCQDYRKRENILGIMGANPKTTASLAYGQQLQERIITDLSQRIERVQKEQSPNAFLEVYQKVDQKCEELNVEWKQKKSILGRNGNGLTEEYRYLKWMVGHWNKSQPHR